MALLLEEKSAYQSLLEDFDPKFRPVIPEDKRSSFLRRDPFFCNRNNLFRMTLHLFFPKYCFSPIGSFIYYWELSRFLIIPVSIVFFILYFILLSHLHPNFCLSVSLVFDFLSIIDLYFRFNTAFYNNDGILITDVCLTVHKYLTTSFVPDLLAAFPWQTLMTVRAVVDLPWLMLSAFKFIPIYRVIRFDSVLAKKGKYRLLIHLYTVSVVFIAVVVFISGQKIINMCFLEYRESVFERIYCKVKLINSNNFDQSHLVDVFILALGGIIGTLLGMRSEIMQAYNSLGMTLLIFYGFCMAFLRIFFIVKCCQWRKISLGDTILSKQKINNFLTFIRKNISDAKTVKYTQKAILSYWENHMPYDIEWMLKEFHPNLRIRVTKILYFNKLKLVSFLKDADEYVLRVLSLNLRELFVTKGQNVVEEFEITKNVYIIYEGEIMVTVGRICPAILGPGCVFGCLHEIGVSKHVFSYEANKHTSLLLIETSRFLAVLKEFPHLYNRFLKLAHPSREYITSGSTVLVNKTYIDVTEISIRGLNSSSKKFVVTYLCVTYFVAYVTVITLCLCYLFGTTDWVIDTLIILDVISLGKIITKLSVPYVDSKTGLIIRDKKLIRKKYMSTSEFVIDIITVVPYIGVDWLLYIKLLRVWVVSLKIIERKSNLFTYKWEVWIHCILTFIIILFLNAFFCAAIFGPKMRIFHLEDGIIVDASPSSNLEVLVNSYLFVSLLLTRISRVINIKFPINMDDALFGICMSSIFVIISGIFFGHLNHYNEKVTYTQRTYENKMNRRRQYLKLRELSQCLLDSTWVHGELLWNKSQGEYFPSAIHSLPYPLKKRIMYTLFGRHLLQSYLFKHTHIDFVKNVCTRLEMKVYFPGESVVVEGDVDKTMYFIHSGEVDVLKTVGKDEEELEGILTFGESFGFCQGLYECRPHPKTYRARSACDILSLRREHWQDLMLFYHAQTKSVYKRAAQIPYEFSLNFDYLD